MRTTETFFYYSFKKHFAGLDSFGRCFCVFVRIESLLFLFNAVFVCLRRIFKVFPRLFSLFLSVHIMSVFVSFSSLLANIQNKACICIHVAQFTVIYLLFFRSLLLFSLDFGKSPRRIQAQIKYGTKEQKNDSLCAQTAKKAMSN